MISEKNKQNSKTNQKKENQFFKVYTVTNEFVFWLAFFLSL